MPWGAKKKPPPPKDPARSRRIVRDDPECRRHGTRTPAGTQCSKCKAEEAQVQTHHCSDGRRRTMRNGVCPGPYC